MAIIVNIPYFQTNPYMLDDISRDGSDPRPQSWAECMASGVFFRWNFGVHPSRILLAIWSRNQVPTSFAEGDKLDRCTVLRRTAECTILYIRTRKPQSNLHEKDVPVFVSREEAGFCCWSDWTYLLWLILCGSCLEPFGRVINEIAFSTRVLDEHFFQSINPMIMNFQWLSLTSTCLKWSPKLSPKLSDAG